MPNFHTPEACADAIARRCAARAARAGAYARIDQRRPAACSTRLRPARCSTASASRARRRSRSTPACRARCLPYPVAVKVLSAEIAHKTDVGGVASTCRRRAALSPRAAMQPRRRAKPGARVAACWCSRWSRARRGLGRLSRRPRRRAAGHGGGRRRPRRDLPRPQPAPGAGRSRHGAGDDRRGARAFRALAGLPRPPKGDLEALARRSSRCRSLPAMAPRSPRPRSIR